MKIGVYFGKSIVSQDNTAGGATTFCQSLISALKNYKSKHNFYVFSQDYSSDEFNTKFVKIDLGVEEESEGYLKKQLFRIPRKIKRLQIETEYINSLNKAAAELQIDLMWFATPAFEFVSVPFIYTVWDLQHRLQSYFPEVSVTGWKYEEREKRYIYAISRAAYVIIGNLAGKDEIVKFYGMPEQRVKTVPLSVPEFAIMSGSHQSVDLGEHRLLPNEFLFYPAQFWPHKNHIVILLALNILEEKFGIKMHVVFTGSDKGNLNFIKQRVEEFDLVNRVHFLNFVSTNVLIELYKKAFALVFPSFFGPDNIPPLEAFAIGCPVIAAQVSGAELQLGDAALLFDPKDENELAELIIQLKKNDNLRKELVAKGKGRVQNFTATNYLDAITKIVDEFEPIRRCWGSGQSYKEI